uniref:Syntaxin-18 n=1 Tax=Corethrella appendiculata TaxID=1370023 RepID=U5EPH8_9DIPT
MDVTPLFKALVKTVRLKTKSTAPTLDKNRILPTSKKPKSSQYEFAKKSKDIKFKITQLRNFLIENRSAYMQIAYHLKNSTQMTDDERALIDRESEKILKICGQLISDFKAENTHQQASKVTKQYREFTGEILDSLQNYLNAVFNIYNEQKQFRIQRELETYKYLKLYSDGKSLKPAPVPPIDVNKLPKNVIDDDDDEEREDEIDQSKLSSTTNQHNSTIRQKSNLSIQDEELLNNSSFLLEELSPEDIQIFESENIQLYNELKGLNEEVEQIEKNVVDIMQLQNIFTEKISLQQSDIERIANTVVGATENVKDANEQINQAIRRNAGLRVWVLFFLIVMSFSLLFLDWYND